MRRITGKAKDETLIEMRGAEDNYASDENGGNGVPLSERTWLPGHSKTDNLQSSNSDTVFFRDGIRRIDFVLAYVDDKDVEKRQERRKEFEANLVKIGLELETEDKDDSKDQKTYFLKLHAPWDVLATYAEILSIRFPFKENDIPHGNDVPLDVISHPFRLPHHIMHPEPDYFTYPFTKSKSDFFLISDRDTFFPPSTRNRIVYYILARCPYYKENEVDKEKTGIKRLINNGTYTAAFPLHDCPYWEKASQSTVESERFYLYNHWARFLCFYKEQPINLIRKYYGERIGIYFAWLGFYTEMLFLAATVGVICFVYGLSSYTNNITSNEICDENIGGTIVMCPLCDKKCPFWNLSSTCHSSWQSSLFDNEGTIFFAIFMGIWVTLFLEFWKRRQARLEYEWDLVDMEEEQPQLQIRPEFEIKCTRRRLNKITQEMEPFLPWRSKCARFCISVTTVIFWLCMIMACIIGVIAYRLAVYAAFASVIKDPLRKIQLVGRFITPQLATSVTASCINFVLILMLNFFYERVAVWITDLEIPKTHFQYENRLTMKMFLFQFVNYYSSCFYVAFFKGKFVGFPGEYMYMFGKGSKLRNEECDPGGCLIELTTQLLIVMIGKQLVGNAQEATVPLLRNWFNRWRGKQNPHNDFSRWEQDYVLQDFIHMGLFYEYLEMVIQFGFITLFVASCPLAPLLALFNNIMEIRVDAWKFTTQFRRPVAAKARNIGAWQEILNSVAIVSVVTNAFIMAFTSDMIPRMVYLYAYSKESNMKGYINDSLSVFNVSHIPEDHMPDEFTLRLRNVTTTCRYYDYRYPPGHYKQYTHTLKFWHIMAAKLAFIIVMEHVVFTVKFFLAWLIPDIPVDIKARITRERYLIQEYLNSYELGKLTLQLSASLVAEPPPEATEERAAAHLREFTEPRGHEEGKEEEEEGTHKAAGAEVTSESSEATELTELIAPTEATESMELPGSGEEMEEMEAMELDEEMELAAVTEDKEMTELMALLGLEEVTESTELTDLTDPMEVPDVAEIIEVTEATEIIEVTEATEIIEVTEATVTEATEIIEVTEATEIIEVTEATEVTEAAEATEDTDIPDVRIE
ncbi:anoctamin-5-like isoform X3 [Nelusetta ayraudi]|uniref:anoctamin-5-like isoform X3 n=1 Tax=Nelusetta ayraudi TaxID=303726 RepID=UPI003F722AD0